MDNQDELNQIKENSASENLWYCHTNKFIANMFEVCSVCDIMREKAYLLKCTLCYDTFVCKEGECSKKHSDDKHGIKRLAVWQKLAKGEDNEKL